MLRRKVYDALIEWKGRAHKPLVISGQRQIGKTYIVREFASREYDGCLEINLSTNPDTRDLFKGDLSVDAIIKRMNVMFPGKPITPGKTLLFFDEIQECMAAYSSLKSFSDDKRFDVIASGSLLGIMMPNIGGSPDEPGLLTPLGYEECMTMYALDFEEFLWAKGVPEDSIGYLKSCIRDRIPIDEVILQSINSYFREFMVVGGMPASVSAFIESGQFTGSIRTLNELNSVCIADINRYNKGIDIVKTLECFDSIPDQLSESNKKFRYSRIRGEKSRKAADRYMENLLWIRGAGYGNFCYAAKDLALPLKSKRDQFKVYLSDTGMLVNRYGENCLKAVYSGTYRYNLGAVAENAVAEGLMKSGYMPRYYSITKGPKRMELDFVVETGDGICVIEVKSGKDRDSPSISKVSQFYDVARRIMLSEENIRIDEKGMEHYPLFAACFFRETEPPWDGPAL